MKSQHVLPLMYVVFGLLSSIILLSIASNLLQFQIFFFLVGSFIFLIGSQLPLIWWKKLIPLGYLVSIGLLIFTLFLNATRGSRGWIPIGPFNLQPSQLAQPLLILSFALWLEYRSLKEFPNLIWTGVLLAVPWLLIVIEPDLGTAMITAFTLLITFFYTDIPKKILAIGLAGVIGVGILGWTFFLHPYQRERVTAFLQPTDLQGAGYNAYQSIVAVGAGQISGRGLGHGVQSQLRFLPERQTDFIFASLAEETGFLGSTFVVSLYFVLIIWILRLAEKKQEHFTRLTLIGFAYLFCCQVFVNIGMNMRLLPITGITLPFISYGGSSLLSFTLVLSFIQRVIVETQSRHTVVFDGQQFKNSVHSSTHS